MMTMRMHLDTTGKENKNDDDDNDDDNEDDNDDDNEDRKIMMTMRIEIL